MGKGGQGLWQCTSCNVKEVSLSQERMKWAPGEKWRQGESQRVVVESEPLTQVALESQLHSPSPQLIKGGF
jgi:hypothetical protein